MICTTEKSTNQTGSFQFQIFIIFIENCVYTKTARTYKWALHALSTELRCQSWEGMQKDGWIAVVDSNIINVKKVGQNAETHNH
jgi:hypothetical protein